MAVVLASQSSIASSSRNNASIAHRTPRGARLIYVHKGSVNTREAVALYQDAAHCSFICRGAHKQKAHTTQRFVCNCSYASIRVEDVEKRRAFYDGRDTGCEAVITAYSYYGEVAVYLYQRGEHNHDASLEFVRLSQHAKSKIVSPMLQEAHGVVQNVVDRVTQGASPDIEGPSNEIQHSALPRSKLLKPSELYRIKSPKLRALRAEMKLLSGTPSSKATQLRAGDPEGVI